MRFFLFFLKKVIDFGKRLEYKPHHRQGVSQGADKTAAVIRDSEEVKKKRIRRRYILEC